MTIKDVNGNELPLVNDDAGTCVYFPNPSNEATKMAMWNALFGETKATIMRHNYLSHTKNGYVVDGNRIRQIVDFDGNLVKELELKETTTTAKTVVSAVSIADAIAVYEEIKDKPGLEKACEIQMSQIRLLIPQVILDAPEEVLRFALKLKK